VNGSGRGLNCDSTSGYFIRSWNAEFNKRHNEKANKIMRCKRKKIKGKANPVADRGGPYGCETSRLLYFV
jgi:hypothetical protein